MKVEQLSIFLENKSGRLAEVTRVLGKAGVNIRALSVAETSDFGILRLIVNNIDKALDALKNSNFTVSRTEVIAVEVPDKPGGLSEILDILENNKVNVEYMYAFVEGSSDNALIVFRFDDNNRAIEILESENVKILNGDSVYNI